MRYYHLGKDPATKSNEFLEKCQKGGGAFSIQKFILQILGTLNRAVWLWNWYKIIISGLRVCMFKLSYCITIVSRLDICPSVTVMTGGLVKFCKFHPRKQFISMQNLCRNMIFTHLFGKFTLYTPFPLNYSNFTFSFQFHQQKKTKITIVSKNIFKLHDFTV